MEPLLRPKLPVGVRRERESSLEGDLPSSDRNPRALQAGDLGDFDRDRLPGFDAGELHTTSKKMSSSLVKELRVVLVERHTVVVGMMNQETQAQCQIKSNDKLLGVSDQVRLKRLTVRQWPKRSFLISTRKMFCTFGIGICELVYLGYPGAQRARRRGNCVISAHHRWAARRF